MVIPVLFLLPVGNSMGDAVPDLGFAGAWQRRQLERFFASNECDQQNGHRI